ncbi:MAG TPA: ArsA family ATPase [Thermoanaerobaculia bacterium]|nr:ArsA family ATPase [Thermoanaerobaculia bacterium]
MTFLFFGGKGGTGKTTCAAATALRHADAGRRVLLVSTDPAHSLGDALGVGLGPEPREIPARRGRLAAAELDAGGALERWLGERRAELETIAERGTYLAKEDIQRFLDLGLPGVDELVGLVELMRLARDFPGDEVVVDTAPTAHTLRLLAMPDELRRFASALDRLQERHRAVATAFGGARQPDRADALITEIETQGRDLQTLLRDPERTAFFWVLLPEALSVEETKDGIRSLEEAGIPVPELIVNRMTPPPTPPDTPCARCEARRQAEREAVEALRAAFPKRPVRFLPALPKEPRGRTALRAVGRLLEGSKDSKDPKDNKRQSGLSLESFGSFESLESLLLPDTLRLLFVGGKGGVGKTTCAATLALLLAEARPGRRVLLLSTDPAHSLADALDVPLGDDPRPVPGTPAGLRARELDAPRTFAAWRARHLVQIDEWLAGAAEDDRDQDAWQGLLDLAPPGLDELSAVSALIDALEGTSREPADDLVIVDTAPTGHALRLLEAPGLMQAWVKELLSLLLEYREAVHLGRLAEELLELSRALRRLGTTLHDPARTRFLAVTRAAELPRRETVRLFAELERLDLAAPAVLVDAVTAPGCGQCDAAAAIEQAEIRRLRQDLGRAGRERCAIISAPAVYPPPRGVDPLRDWGRTWTLWDNEATREP